VCDELLPFVIGVRAVVKWIELLEGSVCVPVAFPWFWFVLNGKNV